MISGPVVYISIFSASGTISREILCSILVHFTLSTQNQSHMFDGFLVRVSVWTNILLETLNLLAGNRPLVHPFKLVLRSVLAAEIQTQFRVRATHYRLMFRRQASFESERRSRRLRGGIEASFSAKHRSLRFALSAFFFPTTPSFSPNQKICLSF
ncbi:hypothetical protein CCUS01_04559 [Colletotrichum cuscutae]|uniref:Uncharacterized protein n=1 Tax=Colletotrichum cuscutae TaxID=1209917 RepID=A0AAI9VE69_9PEZI|nr:hypothetical protein CCUS01_04559 [Colletotrichum cuscutae]